MQKSHQVKIAHAIEIPSQTSHPNDGQTAYINQHKSIFGLTSSLPFSPCLSPSPPLRHHFLLPPRSSGHLSFLAFHQGRLSLRPFRVRILYAQHPLPFLLNPLNLLPFPPFPLFFHRQSIAKFFLIPFVFYYSPFPFLSLSSILSTRSLSHTFITISFHSFCLLRYCLQLGMLYSYFSPFSFPRHPVAISPHKQLSTVSLMT